MLLAGRYRLEEVLGQGAFGTVHRAIHAETGASVAVKLLIPHLSRDERVVRRFYEEARNTHRLSHHNTVRVTDFGRTDDGVLFLVMEYLQGRTLVDVLAASGGRLPEPRVRRVVVQVLRSLIEAHGLGIVHRDIKPANLMLLDRAGEPDFVKVLDFGISRSLDGVGVGTVGFVGTPLYASPEQLLGGTADGRSDLYAVGALAYEALTGRHPNAALADAPTLAAYALAVRTHRAPPLGPDACSPRLAALVNAMIDVDIERRPPSAAAALQALEHPVRPALASGTEEPSAAPAPPSRLGFWLSAVATAVLGGSALAALALHLTAPKVPAADHMTIAAPVAEGPSPATTAAAVSRNPGGTHPVAARRPGGPERHRRARIEHFASGPRPRRLVAERPTRQRRRRARPFVELVPAPLAGAPELVTVARRPAFVALTRSSWYPRRSSLYVAARGLDRLEPLWRAGPYDSATVLASMAVVGRTVLFTDRSARLYRLDLDTGRELDRVGLPAAARRLCPPRSDAENAWVILRDSTLELPPAGVRAGRLPNWCRMTDALTHGTVPWRVVSLERVPERAGFRARSAHVGRGVLAAVGHRSPGFEVPRIVAFATDSDAVLWEEDIAPDGAEDVFEWRHTPAALTADRLVTAWSTGPTIGEPPMFLTAFDPRTGRRLWTTRIPIDIDRLRHIVATDARVLVTGEHWVLFDAGSGRVVAQL